eukprot:TRINITY_DN11148_c0_g1_i1.p1 TRINITY_DN11148_c0_g1~~TRINITY_DN11148_c0_g1_i1.p1  ORF type:complete len:100 (-),score=1.38 TRINITY_DN11148_c0_g1_i1:177-437(-)
MIKLRRTPSLDVDVDDRLTAVMMAVMTVMFVVVSVMMFGVMFGVVSVSFLLLSFGFDQRERLRRQKLEDGVHDLSEGESLLVIANE